MLLRCSIVILLCWSPFAAAGHAPGADQAPQEGAVNVAADRVATPADARAAMPPVRGRLDKLGDTPVLYLWGSPRERGYAHGYLLAAQIHGEFSEYLDNSRLSGGPANYDKLVSKYMHPPFVISSPRTRTEIEGLAAGMRARLGDDGMRIAALNRAMGEADLLACNFISDSVGLGCSSFAAWGPLTRDGKTIAGRNLDWLAAGAMVERQLIVVHAADPGAKRCGWVAVTWPGCIGCFTGMNEQGITIAMHDVPGRGVNPPLGVTPRSLVFRDALERAAGARPFDVAASVFGSYRTAVGSNVALAAPASLAEAAAPATTETPAAPAGDSGEAAGGAGAGASGGSAAPSVILEIDGLKQLTGGVTVRRPDDGLNWQACTNHFRRRGHPPTELDDVSPPLADGAAGRCGRYDELQKRLRRIAAGSAAKLDAASAWSLLEAVAVCAGPRNSVHTLLSVVFEPDARRMTVALSAGDRPATRGTRTVIDVARLVGDARDLTSKATTGP